jgi:hypothetical protein
VTPEKPLAGVHQRPPCNNLGFQEILTRNSSEWA